MLRVPPPMRANAKCDEVFENFIKVDDTAVYGAL